MLKIGDRVSVSVTTFYGNKGSKKREVGIIIDEQKEAEQVLVVFESDIRKLYNCGHDGGKIHRSSPHYKLGRLWWCENAKVKSCNPSSEESFWNEVEKYA